MSLRKSLFAATLALAGAFSLTAAADDHGAKAGQPSIVGIASTNADFETLTAALKAADLVATLEGEGPFTVFAPTDAAFEKLPPGTLENLLKPENKAQLAAILTYHVVPGDVKAADVVKLSGAKTVNGQEVSIKVDGSTVKVDGATVVTTDIAASNGTIHVIDAVILPRD